MDKEKAVAIASKYIDQQNEILLTKGIKLLVSEATEHLDFWYFDNMFEFIEKQDHPPGVGGAPGYKIFKKSGVIVVVSWGEYNKIISG